MEVDQQLNLKGQRYELYAMVSHHGSSTRGGHYTCDAKHEDKWFHFNDERISQVRNFNSMDHSDAYILFYTSTSKLTTDLDSDRNSTYKEYAYSSRL